MRLKTAIAFLTLSLVCIISRVSYADTLTETGVGGQNVDGVYIDPYIFTITGPGGTNTLVDMSCLNFNREVNIGQSWSANAVNVASISASATIDGESGLDILADAYLYNEYAAAIGNAQLTSDIQFAIWSIMDPTDVAGYSGYDANAKALAAAALIAAPKQPSSAYANDELFVPSGSYTSGGEPQMFMTDPVPPAVTPEPASLVLLGTGLLSMVGLMRRKQMTA